SRPHTYDDTMTAPSIMDLALQAAETAAEAGEVPIGCVIVRGDEVIATGGNRTIRDNDPTAHAEILAIRQAAGRLGSQRLGDCDLYVTLEPCTMCAGAISFARIRRLYFGAADAKGGGVDSGVRFFAQPTCHHAPEVYSAVGESQSAALLRAFFQARR
ncbi:MAG: tRNA-specific adenosine deaminase, partial [Tardiphaga sp.]|nr:tRNA-specific adenosine deaminase [Tardiphaga sp.]